MKTPPSWNPNSKFREWKSDLELCVERSRFCLWARHEILEKRWTETSCGTACSRRMEHANQVIELFKEMFGPQQESKTFDLLSRGAVQVFTYKNSEGRSTSISRFELVFQHTSAEGALRKTDRAGLAMEELEEHWNRTSGTQRKSMILLVCSKESASPLVIYKRRCRKDVVTIDSGRKSSGRQGWN
eukprot:6462334-Amphidinium_carterae.2